MVRITSIVLKCAAELCVDPVSGWGEEAWRGASAWREEAASQKHGAFGQLHCHLVPTILTSALPLLQAGGGASTVAGRGQGRQPWRRQPRGRGRRQQPGRGHQQRWGRCGYRVWLTAALRRARRAAAACELGGAQGVDSRCGTGFVVGCLHRCWVPCIAAFYSVRQSAHLQRAGLSSPRNYIQKELSGSMDEFNDSDLSTRQNKTGGGKRKKSSAQCCVKPYPGANCTAGVRTTAISTSRC